MPDPQNLPRKRIRLRRPDSEIFWRDEPNFPIDRIVKIDDIVACFERDRKAWAENGEPDKYDSMLNGDPDGRSRTNFGA